MREERLFCFLAVQLGYERTALFSQLCPKFTGDIEQLSFLCLGSFTLNKRFQCLGSWVENKVSRKPVVDSAVMFQAWSCYSLSVLNSPWLQEDVKDTLQLKGLNTYRLQPVGYYLGNIILNSFKSTSVPHFTLWFEARTAVFIITGPFMFTDIYQILLFG